VSRQNRRSFSAGQLRKAAMCSHPCGFVAVQRRIQVSYRKLSNARRRAINSPDCSYGTKHSKPRARICYAPPCTRCAPIDGRSEVRLAPDRGIKLDSVQRHLVQQECRQLGQRSYSARRYCYRSKWAMACRRTTECPGDKIVYSRRRLDSLSITCVPR
jgi:hypothetical protein